MILLIECVVCCAFFTILALRAIYKDPISVIMSYPPAIIKRVEELPQYKETIKRREKVHIMGKMVAIVVFVFFIGIPGLYIRL